MKYGISINIAKSKFLVPCGRFLGHIVYKAGIVVDLNKVAAIFLLPILEHITRGKPFLGATSYYRQHIYFYAQLVLHLNYLIKKIDLPSIWIDKCTKAYNQF